MKRTYLLLLFLFALLIFVSCKKKDEPQVDSVLGKWIYHKIIARNYEGQKLTKEEEIFVGEGSAIDFQADSTYSYNLYLSRQQKKRGTWSYLPNQKKIIFDNNLDSAKNWTIIKLTTNQLQSTTTESFGNKRFEHQFELKKLSK